MNKRHLPWAVVLVMALFMFSMLNSNSNLSHAQSCTRSYAVRWGDTLASIAAEQGVEIAVLVNLNNIEDIDVIYAGSMLCLEASEIFPFSNSSFALVAEYEMSLDADISANGWTLGQDRRIGVRLPFRFNSGDNIGTYNIPEDVMDVSLDQPDTLLYWLARNEFDPPFTYTLVAIKSLDLINELHFGMPKTLDELFPSYPSQVEIDEAVSIDEIFETSMPVDHLMTVEPLDTVTLTAELVTVEGNFIPIHITHYDYHATIEAAELIYGERVAFALHEGPNGNDLLMVLSDDGSLGPPGPGWRSRCNTWSSGGWWSRFRYSFYGCG